MIRGARTESANDEASHVTDIQILVPLHVAAKRIAGGNVEAVTARPVYWGPASDEARPRRCASTQRHFGGGLPHRCLDIERAWPYFEMVLSCSCRMAADTRL